MVFSLHCGGIAHSPRRPPVQKGRGSPYTLSSIRRDEPVCSTVLHSASRLFGCIRPPHTSFRSPAPAVCAV